MAASKEYMAYILDQLSELEEITSRPMMGEYVLYYRGRVFGGVYDDRLLFKPVHIAQDMLPDAAWECPYLGAKEMLLVDPEDRERLCAVVRAMYDELPAPKRRK